MAGTSMTTSMITRMGTIIIMTTTTATRMITIMGMITHMARSGTERGETNEAANPLQVGVFRAHAEVLHAQSISDLVEQAPRRHDILRWCPYSTNVQVPIPVDVIEESRT